MLTVEAHEVLQPRFPVIDAHNHLGDAFLTWSDDWLNQPVSQLIATMDEAGVRAIVDLDGRWGDRLRAELARYQEPYPDRFAVFSGIDYDNFATDPSFGETEAKRLRESVALGARGLKVWKTLGLRLRDTEGKLIPVDDPRLDPLWATAGGAQRAGPDSHRRPGRLLHSRSTASTSAGRSCTKTRTGTSTRRGPRATSAIPTSRRSTRSWSSSRVCCAGIPEQTSSARTSAATPKTSAGSVG